ncbi:MAG: hypothetical protein V4726_08510 [Verrucomicrobiota bacterium]
MTSCKTKRLIAVGALFCSATFLPSASSAATFLASDVSNWIGPAAGTGVSQAVLVIQWPGQSGWAWGIRWNTADSKNGGDLLMALAGTEPRFRASISGTGFVSNLTWDSDLNGTADLSFPAYNAETGQYLNYFVNNNQQDGNFNNGAAPAGAHILPPLGSPYDEGGPGVWVSSNTGSNGRPLADGSWDGWVYADFSSSGPGAVVNAPALVPEPGSSVFLLFAAGSLLRRRRAA